MENLGIDMKLLVAQLINFALFAWVFKKYLAKPFQNFIAQEKLQDEEKERIFAEAKAVEEGIEKREQKQREKAKKEYAQLMSDAKVEAETAKNEIIEAAHAEAAQIKDKAQIQIDAERAAMQTAAQEQIRELSFYLVNTSLKEVLSEDMKKKITASILKNSPKSVSLSS